MTERLLHFTLGPVQSFVGEARRTGDLWAGSFLLSWLAGQAMYAVVRAGGRILVPDVQKNALFHAVTHGAGQFGPAIGSLPNRFKAEVPERLDPDLCREAVHKAWRDLADTVWRRFVDPVAGAGNESQGIWDRQVNGFWETAWVTGSDAPDGGDQVWLDRRKNWRTHRPPIEAGDHCMLMGDRQELSGFVRSRERARQDEFWRALRAHVGQASGNPLQLEENERLCAIALVKRLFSHVARDVLGWRPSWDGQQPLRWPSTPRLAATGWLRHAWGKARAEAHAFATIAQGAKGGLMEPVLDPGNLISQVPGALLHRSGIENARPGELAANDTDAKATRGELLQAYGTLSKKAGQASPFYALLLMDGDKVGALLREGEASVTKGLAEFSSRVDATVRGHGGYTVYAGGDDVLALLPMEDVLPAALKLRDAYCRALSSATISASIVFAHFHVPLRRVLREAHRQLDDVAKDGNGRDSVALCVLTQTGVTRAWVSTWGPDEASPQQTMIDAAREMDGMTSGRLLYAIREQYDEVIAGRILGSNEMKEILLAEYRRSAAGAARTGDIRTDIDRLFTLAARHAGAGSPRDREAPLVSMDGPLIARFLARETKRA